MSIHGPHVSGEDSVLKLSEGSATEGLTLLSNISKKGRGGGGAILLQATWTHVSTWTWSNRFLFVRLRDPNGIEHSFAVFHCHHDATIWSTQWDQLSAWSHLLPPSTIFLSDHNSVILRTRDVSYPRTAPELKDVPNARQKEVSFLTDHKLLGVYATLHECRTEEFPSGGWTWGAPSANPDSAPPTAPTTCNQHEKDLSDTHIDREHCIDYISIPSSSFSAAQECYPSFLGSSDHKADVFTLQTKSPSCQRRKRCPVSFLQCDDTIAEIAAKLGDIQTTSFAGWAHSMTVIKIKVFEYEKQHKPKGVTEVHDLLRESTVHGLAPRASDFLLA